LGDFITVSQPGRKSAVVPLLAPRRVNQKELCSFDHDGWTKNTVYQSQPQVRPGHHPASSKNVTVLDKHLGRVDFCIRKARLKLICLGPMSCQ
jgi:hypothetical protein